MADGRLSCSCPAFTHHGECKHTDTVVAQDFAAWCPKHKGIKAYYTATAAAKLVAPSHKVRLEDLYR